jgi:hypothetical protein
MKPMVEPWCPSWVGCVDVVPGWGEREIELGGSRMVRAPQSNSTLPAQHSDNVY